MQADKQNCDPPREPLKRNNSITRFPKNGPTYVVAFSMHETYDDLMTAQQMICKKSPQGSIDSVTPTNSVKVIESNANDKCSFIIDMPEDSIDPKDANKCFEVEEVTGIESDVLKDDNNSTIEIIKPEVIFNALHATRSRDNTKLRKKSRKNKRVAKSRTDHFKCKRSQKSITKKLELYCTKSKRHTTASEVLDNRLCNLSNILTQSRVLRKVPAVGNLLEVRSPQTDDVADDEISSMSSSTTKKGILSHSSDNTITRKWSSTSSRIDDCSITNEGSSVIQVSSENVIPYKNDVFNVAVAVAFNKNKINERKLTTMPVPRKEDYLATEDLTGTETVIIPQPTLTSTVPSYDNTNMKNKTQPQANSIKDSSSDVTLTDNRKKSSLIMSIDEDTFLIARTSSDFNKSTLSSDLTLSNSESQSDNTVLCQKESVKAREYNNKKLLDTVINLGFFPEATPSTSKFDANAVIVTKEHKTYTKKQDEEIYTDHNDLSKNILKKTFDHVKNFGAQKIINLPDEAAIRAKLKENQETQRKAKIEYQTPEPSTIAELWDKLVLLIDNGLKRIEESLPERIIRELKKVFDIDDYKNFIMKVISERKELNTAAKEMDTSTKGVCVDMTKTESNKSLQCNLVQNQVIDQLMSKLHPEGTNDLTNKLSHKLITKIFKEYFEVVTPAVASDYDVKDDVTVSGTEPELAGNVERFRRLKILLAVPLKFVKENAFVMTSVPTFFILLLSMYGLVIFIMKPL